MSEGPLKIDAALAAALNQAPVALLWCEQGQVRWMSGGPLGRLGLDEAAVGNPLSEVLPDAITGPLVDEAHFHVMVGETRWEVHRGPQGPHGMLLVLRPQVDTDRGPERDASFLHAVLDNLPDMVFVKEAEALRYVQVNRAVERMLGLPREAILGKRDYDLFPTLEADAFTGKDRAVLDARKPVEIDEERMPVPGGEPLLLHTRKVPLLDADGAPRYLLGLSRDITAQRQLEEERDALLERLETLDELKVRFVSDLSHELRTPMAMIAGLTQRVLDQGHLPEARRRDLEDVLHAVRLLRGLVDELMEVSQLEEGHASLHYVEVDLARQSRLTAGAFDTLASHRDIRLTVEAPTSLMAQVDLDKFDRILINLLANAIRFTPPGGTVRCLLGVRGDEVVLGVQDSGPGVPREEREQVFSRYHSTHPNGAGLGLPIVRVLARMHGGEVAIRDGPGPGAWFQVILPRWAPAGTPVRPATPAPRVAPPSGELSDEGAPPPGDPRPLILIVEDHAEMNRYLARLLSPEYRVVQASDGVEGLEQAQRLAPDLVLTDFVLPRLDGTGLIRALRRDPRLAYVPIIVLSGQQEVSAEHFLRHGAQDYVTKPFSEDELRMRVRNALTMKRTRDLLQREVASRDQDLVVLAGKLTDRTRELQTALETAVVARQQAERALKLRADFLALIAHEVRTPMQALKLGLEVLQRRTGGEQAPPEVARVVRAGDRLHKLVESMLDYATAESARAEMRQVRVDLVRLTRELVEEHRRRAEAKGLELRLETEVISLATETDPRLVRLILTNLLDNAIKFTRRGSVTVWIDRRPPNAVIRIRDTGPGIAPQALDDVFEPFTHLAPMRTKHLPGTGLGLALVRDIAHTLGGEVHADSVVGVGSTFSLELPLELNAPQS